MPGKQDPQKWNNLFMLTFQTVPHRPILLFPILLALICCFSTPTIVSASENTAVIENIKLANTRDDLLIYFDIKQAFTEKMSQAVLNGVPASFSFQVVLYKTDGSFFDKKIANIQIKSSLKYNPLKKEFSVSRPWKNEAPVITTSFEEAKTLMTEIDNLTIIALQKLAKGDKYQLRVKAELDKVTLPLSLHYVFFFVSFWDFETNWYLINFTY